jgi:hypothetical protein
LRRLPTLGFTPSQAFGVGHSAANAARFIPCRPAPCDGVGFACRFSFALARGVGHRRMNSVRLPPLDCVSEQARRVGHWIAFPACEDEQSLAPVGRAHFLRRKESHRKAVAHADQVSGDFGKSEAEMVRDIFEEHEGWFAFADNSRDLRPQMPWVVRTAPPSGDGEWLARIASKEDVHAITPASAVEGGNVVPDRSPIQGRVFHPGHEDGRSIGFPLDVTHTAVSADCEVQREIESGGAGAKRQPEERATVASRIASGGM